MPKSEDPIYLVSGSFRTKEDQREAARALMNKIVAIGRTEAGVLDYHFYEDWDEPGRFALHEVWESKAAHDAHFNSDAMQALLPGFFEFLAEPPTVTYYDASIESQLET